MERWQLSPGCSGEAAPRKAGADLLLSQRASWFRQVCGGIVSERVRVPAAKTTPLRLQQVTAVTAETTGCRHRSKYSSEEEVGM